jgi:hypothetical protein
LLLIGLLQCRRALRGVLEVIISQCSATLRNVSAVIIPQCRRALRGVLEVNFDWAVKTQMTLWELWDQLQRERMQVLRELGAEFAAQPENPE